MAGVSSILKKHSSRLPTIIWASRSLRVRTTALEKRYSNVVAAADRLVEIAHQKNCLRQATPTVSFMASSLPNVYFL